MLPYRILIIFFACLCHQHSALHPDFGPPPPSDLPPFPFDTSASAQNHHSHCALLIPGHSKSSSFDHARNVFNGIHHHSGEGFTCITFHSVDSAFIAARDKFGLPRPKKPATSPDIGNLGRVLVEATKTLAKQYGLPKDVIVNGLPLIDSLKSIVGSICFDFLKNKECKIEKYRTYDGRCNNLKNPNWGSALTTFKRRIGPDYANGIDAPRISKLGHSLPSARAVSAHVHRDEGLHDHAVTIMNVAWGQAIDHDMTLTAETKLPGTKEDPRCCDRDANFPECFPIRVSKKDAFFALFKQNCLNVVRSVPGVAHNCKFGPRTQINEISAYLDGNWIYGSSDEVVNRLRLFKGGLLKSLPVFREYGLKDLLPLKLEDPEEGCIRPNQDLFCFDAGDGRVNEQLVLAVVHTIMMREHNRLATELHKINPHWNDEKLYQESRHIVAALIQHITYNEYLPMILGKEVMQKFGLILKKHGYFDGYDPHIDATMASDFITSAFRFGHSLLPSTIERWSPGHKYIASQRLGEMLRQPFDLYKGGWCDQFTMGLVNQVAQAMDDAITQEVTNHLFQEPLKKFGMDLAALNMQRGREHGLPSYNEFRHFCGLHPIRSWHELEGVMPNKTVKRYLDVYKHPDDIDLWSGGVTERPLPGSMVGPTFACLLALTFKELRVGDRFWYENKGYPSSFSQGQLEEIRKVKFSRIICDNSDDIKTIQVYVMVLPDHDINPRVPCASGILPRIDLTKWRDHSHRPLHPQHDHKLDHRPILVGPKASLNQQRSSHFDEVNDLIPGDSSSSLDETPETIGLQFLSKDLTTTFGNSSFLSSYLSTPVSSLASSSKGMESLPPKKLSLTKILNQGRIVNEPSDFSSTTPLHPPINHNSLEFNPPINQSPLETDFPSTSPYSSTILLPVENQYHDPSNSHERQPVKVEGSSESGLRGRWPTFPLLPLHDPSVEYCDCTGNFHPLKDIKSPSKEKRQTERLEPTFQMDSTLKLDDTMFIWDRKTR